MKKLLISFVLFASLIGVSFAENFFAHRFFEVKVDVPVEVSNNLIGITDIFQKDVVIDLAQIADNVANKGAAIKGSIAPALSFGIDIPRGLILGVKVGAEADIGVGFSDDLFEFLGKGNVGMNNKYKLSTQNTYADIFATASVNAGWNKKKSRIEFTGTAFSALAHFDASDTYAMLYINDTENSFGYEANLDAKLYSNFNVAEGFNDVNAIINAVTKNMGFDLSASYNRDLFRFLTIGATARIPLAPSKLSLCSSVSTKYSGEYSIEELLGSEDSNDDGDSAEETAGEETSDSSSFDPKNMLGDPIVLTTPYAIHRPMKIGVTANFHPFGSLLSTSGYLGIGIRHPFASAINSGMDVANTDYYIDYAISGRLSLWNIISLELSHEHMDEVYKNALALSLNIRLVEVDAGVSIQSPNFTKSFTGAGLGAFATVAIGF